MSCSPDKQVSIDSIRVVKIDQHPTLVDHERKLVIVDEAGQTIDELKTYPDTGDGCDLFLFDTDDKFVLIDCNGHWFSVEKTTGQLTNEGWKWQETLPTNQLGVFKRGDDKTKYKFVTESGSTMGDVYKFKDPHE